MAGWTTEGRTDGGRRDGRRDDGADGQTTTTTGRTTGYDDRRTEDEDRRTNLFAEVKWAVARRSEQKAAGYRHPRDDVKGPSFVRATSNNQTFLGLHHLHRWQMPF